MAITPNTNLRLLKVPIEIDSKNQLNFANRQAQLNYFKSLPYVEVDNISYQRKDNIIRYPSHIDYIINYNYVMYQNTNYSDQWFYAFITKMEYINDYMTEITIKTDVFQTWQFDIIYNKMFVEREHVNNDTIGAHTVPEGLETGEYIVNNINTCQSLTEIPKFILASTIDTVLDETGKLIGGNIGGGKYGGIKSGYKYFAFETGTQTLNNVLKAFEDAGKSDAIGMLFLAPKSLFNYEGDGTQTDNVGVADSSQDITSTWAGLTGTPLQRLTSLNGYTPKNKKLLTFPYCFMKLTNNNGGNAVYKYEYWSSPDGNPEIAIHGTICPGMSIKAVPLEYKGVNENFNEALTGAKFPICGWNTDVYTNWLTQNGVNIGLSLATGIGEIAGGITGLALGNPVGITAVGGGLGGITNTLAEVHQKSFASPQAEGNVNSGDVSFGEGTCTFSAYAMSIKSEFAKIIDDYFSMFGYKVNTLKVPNINGRQNWNYVKTIDCNIHAYIPQEDVQELKDMFNSGVTIWHNPNTFLDYSQNNSII